VNFRAKHPHANRPVTDYFAPLILLPAQLGGNNIGVLAGAIFPKDVLIVGSCFLLICVTAKVAFKGIKMWQAENQAAQEKANGSADPQGEGSLHEPMLEDGLDSKVLHPKDLYVETDDQQVNQQAIEYLKGRERPDLGSVGILLLLWGLFSIVYVLLKEAKTCSTSYWLLLISLYPLLIVFTLIGAWWLLKDQKRMESLISCKAIKPMDKEVRWDLRVILVYGGASVAVGFVGGLLGLGGAEFMAPLMLEMGMAPPAAAATAAYMNLFTSASNIVHYSQIPGVLPPHYTGWFCATAFIAGLCGRSISSAIAAAGKQSIMILALASVLGVSMILLAWRGINSSADWSFHPDAFC